VKIKIKWRVREVALQKGLTSMQLAELAGINKNTATALWHGRPTRVDIPTLERLCKALECRIEDILEQTEEWRAAHIAGGQPNTMRAALT